MASLINILIPVKTFLEEIDPLMKQRGMFFYTEYRAEGKRSVVEGWQALDDTFHAAYITSAAFDTSPSGSFFDDQFAFHVIEILGGRSTGNDLENLSLRIVSKSPDPVTRKFFTAIEKYLKANTAYGRGIGPGTSSFYGKVFYHKPSVIQKTLWFDLQRKVRPIVIPDLTSPH